MKQRCIILNRNVAILSIKDGDLVRIEYDNVRYYKGNYSVQVQYGIKMYQYSCNEEKKYNITNSYCFILDLTKEEIAKKEYIEETIKSYEENCTIHEKSLNQIKLNIDKLNKLK